MPHLRKSINRRQLVGRTAALGTGAILAGKVGSIGAQGTPVATPVASPVAVSADYLAKQDQVVAEIQAMAGKKLRILSAVVGGKTPEEDALFAQEITRLTGLEVELVHPTADYDQKLLADLSAGVEYDLIYTNKNTLDVLIDQGAVSDISDWVKNSPLLQDPTVIPTAEWDLIRYPDDKFYAVFQKFEGARMVNVRQDWLEKLGLATPVTLDDFYNVMVAFRDQDPDGNGQADTFGLSMAVGIYDIQPFMSSAGVLPGYVMDGETRTIPYATEAAIPVYEWLAKLYAEKLLDPNFATNETADMRNMFIGDKVGMVTYWDTWVGLFNNLRLTDDPNTAFKCVGITGAQGPDGKVILNRGQPSVWFVPSNAKEPEAAFKFTEWWNTFPGITLGSIGILDNDYTVSGETITLTDLGKEHSMDHGQPTPYNTNWVNPVGVLPGVKEAQVISMRDGYLATNGPDWSPNVEPILTEFISKAILGEITAADAVSQMQEQLKSQSLID